MQYALFLAGIIALFMTFLCLPETSHPGTRGIDKLYEHGSLQRGGFKWVWINPFRSLLLLKSPNMILIVRRRPSCRASLDSLSSQTLASIAGVEQ